MVFTGGGGISEEVAVQITGDSTDAMAALDGAESALMSVHSAVGLVGGALVGLAGVMAGKAVNAARSFEQQMVELEKVTSPQTARQMGDAIQDMAEQMPLAHRELSEIAAQAGRLGVEGVENIEEFTRVTGEMAVATNLTADEAADAFARITQLTGTPIDQVEELGSSVNALSNDMSTTSSEITDAVLRSGAALSQLGLSTEEILGLSASINEVSESSERAGTRLRRVAQEMMNPKNVEDLAAALGMSAEEFTAMRDESPLRLIQRMIEAFAEGGETADALRSTLSTASRQGIAALAQNLDGLETALDTSNEQFENATSLTEEFEAANSTFNAELQRTESRLRNIAIVTGETLLPHLSSLLDELNRGLDAFGRLNDETDGMAGTVALAGTAVVGLGAALAGLAAVASGPIATALSAVGGAVAALTGPIGIAIGLAAALAAAYATNFGGLRDSVDSAIQRIDPILSRLEPVFEAAQSAAGDLAAVFRNDVAPALRFLEPLVGAVLDALLGVFTTNLDFIVTVIRSAFELATGDIDGFLSQWRGFFERTLQGIGEFLDKWTNGAFGTFVSNITTGFLDLLTNGRVALNQLFNSFATTFNGISTLVIEGIEQAGNTLLDGFNQIIQSVNSAIEFANENIPGFQHQPFERLSQVNLDQQAFTVEKRSTNPQVVRREIVENTVVVETNDDRFDAYVDERSRQTYDQKSREDADAERRGSYRGA
jgi:TP901 family phage tail tape measure protein